MQNKIIAREFSVNHKIFTALTNEGGGQIVLAIHGWLDNAASFIPLMPYLESCEFIAIDLIGHGRSSHRPLGTHYHLIDYVYDLHELIEAQQWKNIVLVGHSLGGIIASLYAAIFDNNIKHLVSIEALGPLEENDETTVRQLRNSMLSRFSSAKANIRHPQSFDSAVKARLAVSDLTKENASIIMKRNTLHDTLGVRWTTDRRLRTISPIRFTPNQAKAVLANIHCNSHFILGTEGFATLKLMANTRKVWLQNAIFSEIKGGHHTHMDSPSDVAKCINSIL